MKKPNVLFITVDQMRIHEMGCYTKDIRLRQLDMTPNIDALARNSVRFENAFSPNPVCTPSRSSMISGRYGRSCIGTVGNASDPIKERTRFNTKTIAELFRDNGYDTAIIGKWHIHNSPETLGFDFSVYQKVYHLNKNQEYINNGKNEAAQGNAYEYELDATQKFLGSRREKPFFLFHNISLPHMPYFDVDDEYKYKYQMACPPLRENAILGCDSNFNDKWYKIYYYDHLFYNNHGDQYKALPDNFNLQTLYSMYCGMISAADMQVGRLMDMLRQNNLIEDTIVVFCSDHGDNMGSHSMFNKDCSYEESIHIPLLISHPGKITANKNNDCVSLIDIAPTLLEMCSLNMPDYFDGISLRSVIYDNTPLERDKVFFECTNGEIGCRTKEFLFSSRIQLKDYVGERADIQNPCFRFFDMARDPYQINNLAESELSEHLENKKAILQQAVENWNKNTPWLHPVK